MNIELIKAKEELGEKEFNDHLRNVFGITCLDFVETIVINLPESCYANCSYCIDKELRKTVTTPENFLIVCEKVLKEFPQAKNICITGGTLNAKHFNKMIEMINIYLPNAFITWNTNGVNLDASYNDSLSKIHYVNLHRNSVDEVTNKKIFRTCHKLITLEEAKQLLGEKLFLRVTIDESFDLDEYVNTGIPLYLNRLLPGTKKSNEKYKQVLDKLHISETERKRRNVYITSTYKNVPIRICCGDKLATHIPNRKPTYLNVAIIHRSGKVCGSWYEDDKVIYIP